MEPLYAILGGVLPPLIWLAFWTKEDDHPEPRGLMTACFIGGAIAVFFAVGAEQIVANMFTDEKTKYVAWAAIEEALKLIVVITIALPSRNNKEPISAMMYCITVALGFAALENTFFIMKQFSMGSGIWGGLNTGNMRFVGPTLVHTVSTALIGFSYGYLFYHNSFMKFIALLLGFCGAIALHAAFNISILNANSNDTIRSFAWVWFAVVILIVLFEEIKAVREPVRS